MCSSDLPHSLAAADVAVVTLSDGASGVSVPSKTYNLMAAGAPLLCIASPQTELSRLVETYDNGRCFRRDDLQGMQDYLEKLASDPARCAELRRNSLRASRDFTPENARIYVSSLY